MTALSNLTEFTIAFMEQMEITANQDGVPLEQTISDSFIEILQDLAQIPEMKWVDFQKTGTKNHPTLITHCWGLDKHERLHLCAVLLPTGGLQELDLPFVFNRRQINDLFRKMLSIPEQIYKGVFFSEESDSDISDMMIGIRKILNTNSPEIAFHILTPGQFKGTMAALTSDCWTITGHLYDIEWLRRSYMNSSGGQLNLRDQDGGGLPCLVASHNSDGEPNVLLTTFSGEFLAALYDRRRDELLRQNVRIYLRQNRKVNRKIANSARENPKDFIALNNGISAVATDVSFNPEQTRIETLNDLQIVNGGQTTATLHEVWRKKKNSVDLSEVRVQAKITIIDSNLPEAEELAKEIAIAANSQTRITSSDLLSHDLMERGFENISRERRYTIGTQETGWYYERVRGQYAGLLAMDKKNERIYPKNQVIDKMTAAQLNLAWQNEPYMASRGREKALTYYKEQLKKKHQESLPEATVEDFDHLVGLALIRREAEGPIAIERTMKPPVGFYLLAWLSQHYSSQIDLQQLARTGRLPDWLILVIQRKVPEISKVMRTHPSNTPHESERPKKEESWQAVRMIKPLNIEAIQIYRDFTRQDWQAAVTWIQPQRKYRTLKDKVEDCLKLVESGKVTENRGELINVMQQLIEMGFKMDITKIQRPDLDE